MKALTVCCWIALAGCALGEAPQIASLAAAAARSEPSRLREVALEVMRRTEFCALITVDDGAAQARTMQPFPPEDDLTVWMGTRKGTRKLEQLARDPRATLYYPDSDNGAYVTMLGTIEVIAAPEDRSHHWRDQWIDFYDGGPNGDDYVLLRFTPHRVEVISVAEGVAAGPKSWRPAILELREDR